MSKLLQQGRQVFRQFFSFARSGLRHDMAHIRMDHKEAGREAQGKMSIDQGLVVKHGRANTKSSYEPKGAG